MAIRLFRKTVWKKLVILIVLVAAGLLAADIWLSRRAGPEYFGEPERLLPPGTAAVATWLDLNAFIAKAEELESLNRLRADEDFATFLLTDPTWRKIQKEKDKIHYKILTGMARNFVSNWFGREVTLALVPPRPDKALPENSDAPTTGTARSGLLVIARTDAGFEENLAELVLQYYPELSLESREYRGRRIHRYNAEKSRRAFSYCRFGKTVVVSLRSAGWNWIEDVVDRKIGVSPAGDRLSSLAEDPSFESSAPRREVDEGLGIHIHPRRLVQALRDFPSDSPPGESEDFWYDYSEELFQNVEWSAWKLELDRGLRLQSFWKIPPSAVSRGGKTSDPGNPSRVPGILKSLPADTSLLLFAESEGLRETFLDLRGRMAEFEKYAGCLDDFEADWKNLTETEFTNHWLEPLDKTFGMALTGLTGGALFPLPVARAWWDCDSAESASRIGRLMAARAPKPSVLSAVFLQLGYRLDKRRTHLGLNDPDFPPLPIAAPPSSPANPVPNSPPPEMDPNLLGQELLSGLWPPGRAAPVLCLFANFESGYEHLTRLHTAAKIWSKDVREDVEYWETLLGAMRHLHALRLTAVPVDGGVEVDLLISVD